MTPERYQQINQLLDGALERAPDEQSAFIATACGDDTELRREVESLLAACAQARSFIEKPPAELATELTAEPMTGRTFGHYRLGALLGAGGMGEVYRARDTRLDREVAVKILPAHLADNAEALRRFEREAKAVAALSHPNILAIHDFGTEAQVSYAVMELLEGETLRARLRRAALPWREAVEIGVAVAEGLAAAHAKGIVHRDLKPENIFLTADGQVKILDFGIARVKPAVSPAVETSAATLTEATRPGTLLGTIGYMSPEQVRGEAVEAPGDIFALGCVLYEMVSGQQPFARANAMETMAAILRDEPPALAGQDLPAGLPPLIGRCLAKRPGQRYQSARDLAFDLRALASGTGAVKAASAPLRWRPVVWLGAVAAVLLLLVLVWLSLAGKAIDSLAILPLLNASGDANAEYLSDGITESLITSLSQLPKLRVMARNTVFTYKGKEVDPRKIGQELQVRAVFMGQVKQRDDMLIINTELVNAADGARLWGGQYSQKLSGILALQAELAKQISEQLRLTLTGEQRQRLTKQYTENTEAYLLYTRGRHFSSNFWTADGFQKGIEQLNRAIALDPAYALAHAGLATTYYEASSVWLPPDDAMSKAKAAALNALRLDETLAEAHTALALVLSYYEWNWKEAGEHFQLALAYNPNYAPAHLYYGQYLAEQGQLAAGREELKQALRLDPLTPSTSMLLALNYYVARRYDEALTECRKILDLKADFYMGHSILGQIYEQQGKLAEAITAFQESRRLDPEQPFTFGHLGHAYALAGQPDQARKMLAEMKRRAARAYVSPVAVAFIYVGLGEKDEAFVWLEKARQERDENLIHYKDAPIFASIRSEPRFKELLRRMNLAP